MSESTGMELITIESKDALAVFTAADAIDSILARVRAEIDAFHGDVSTAGGRKEIASMAHKVSKAKASLEKVGDTLAKEVKEIPKKVDATRRKITTTLEKWRDEVRQPLTDWETAEEARVDRLKANLAELHGVVSDQAQRAALVLRERLAEVKAEDVSETAYAEFAGLAAEAKLKAIEALEARIIDADKREAEAAELARLRAEAAARAKEEADAKAKADAEERERKAAESAAAAERAKAEAAIKAAKDEAERKEREHKAALEAAERKAVEAAARAKAEVEAQAQREAAEKARREADREHRATINRAALSAFVDGGVAEDIAKQVVTLIAAGNIPAVTINY